MAKPPWCREYPREWSSLDPVSSPTFVLVNQYRRPAGESLYHMDAYRITNALEARFGPGLMLGQKALVIEWAEQILPALPRERLVIVDAMGGG